MRCFANDEPALGAEGSKIMADELTTDCCAASYGKHGTIDFAILGGGSAAFASALRASDLGASVLMVNDGTIGGTCVNVGCVPSKTLIRAAENHYQHGVSRFRGLKSESGRLDFSELMREKDELVAGLRQAKYTDVLKGLPNVHLVEGRGKVVATHEIEVAGKTYTADKLLIATGTRPALPAVPGLSHPDVWDSTRALEATAAPKRLIVLGGRYIALELGQMFARLGSKVTLVQRSKQILPGEDADLASALAEYLGQEGIQVLAGRQVAAVVREEDAFHVEVKQSGATEILEADAVVAALGRTPNTDGLGLIEIGVELGHTGAITVGEDLQTNVPGIYAAGDVIGKPAYVYAAAYEGALAAENALGSVTKTRDYTAIPWVVFTDPQVAGVGLNERAAAEAGVEVDVSVLPLDLVPRALAARDTRGFVKLLRARGEDRLVGARVLAPEGGEQIMEASLMVKFGLPISEVARHFHPYLTQGEAMKLAALGLDRDVETLSCCAS